MRTILITIAATLFTALAAAQKPNMKTENVVVVFKTHFDIGYTDLAGSVVSKYQNSMIEGALKVIDKTSSLPGDEHFTWTLPAWPMKQILEGSSPAVKSRVADALRNRYLAVHALPFTIETEASDLETLARSFQCSSDISAEYGLPLPRDAKMTDVPEHSWILPTVLTNAGVKFLHLGCNAASQSPELPDLFWWEGPDGSKLLTMYSWKYYGTDVVPPEGWPYKTWIAIIHTNDNTGAPGPEVVEETIREIKKLNPNAHVMQGRMSDFYDYIIKENAEIPVVRKDMPDTWIHGYMSMPREVRISRETRTGIFTLDKLNTELNLWKSLKNDVSAVVKNAVENSLLFDEHTFGLAMSHGASGIWCYGDQFRTMKTEDVFGEIEFSWKEKGQRIVDAERVIKPGLNDMIRDLAGSVAVQSDHITVYNPLPWSRDGLVTLQIHSSLLKNANAVRDLSTGEELLLSNKNNIITFVAHAVPAMGYKTFIPVSSGTKKAVLVADKKKNVLENKFLKVTVDPVNGGLASVLDKKSGREMVGKESGSVFGGYIYERFSRESTESYARDYIKGGWDWAPAELGRPNLSDDKYMQVHPVPYTVSYEADDVKVRAILHFRRDDKNPHDYTMVYTLFSDQPYLEIRWGISGKSPESWPEAGWISFPFNVKDPQFRLGRLGAISDPAKDYIKNSNLDYCFVNSGITVTGKDNSGFGVFSPDVPGVSLDRPGLWKFTRNFVPAQPNVFFNLYNNQWSTNFTEWIDGSWSTRFFIWPVGSFDPESSLVTPSEEFRVPLLAAFSSAQGGVLPPMAEGVTLSMKGVLLTAFGKNPYGDGLILRIWEQAGKSGSCNITLPAGLNGKVAVPVNLRGEAAGIPFVIMDNSFSVNITPYKPYSFMII